MRETGINQHCNRRESLLLWSLEIGGDPEGGQIVAGGRLADKGLRGALRMESSGQGDQAPLASCIHRVSGAPPYLASPTLGLFLQSPCEGDTAEQWLGG